MHFFRESAQNVRHAVLQLHATDGIARTSQQSTLEKICKVNRLIRQPKLLKLSMTTAARFEERCRDLRRPGTLAHSTFCGFLVNKSVELSTRFYTQKLFQLFQRGGNELLQVGIAVQNSADIILVNARQR